MGLAERQTKQQRHFGPSSALASNRDLTAFPIDIFQFQSDDFAGAESKPGKQHKHRFARLQSRRIRGWCSNGPPQDFPQRHVMWVEI